MKAPSGPPVITCPNRLYSSNFAVIKRVAHRAFGFDGELITDVEAEKRRRDKALSGDEVVVFGEGYSGEVGIKAPSEDGATGSFKVDYLLTRVDSDLRPISIVAIEVQAIDTTSSFSDASKQYYLGKSYSGFGKNPRPRWTEAGFNWENVTKRILPQLIYKGHALRRERLAAHGLFFILPDPVLSKILTRVGGHVLEYPIGPGTVTFQSYQLEHPSTDTQRALKLVREFTTSVEQIAYAFVSPQNLPDLGTYERTLTDKLAALARRRKI